jgi:alpha-D-ribose 1-methylphosphonate 5-triphosphate diphosphatase PhnM
VLTVEGGKGKLLINGYQEPEDVMREMADGGCAGHRVHLRHRRDQWNIKQCFCSFMSEKSIILLCYNEKKRGSLL